MIKVGELREQITQNAKIIKKKAFLKNLATISDLLRKAADDDCYELLSESEMWQVSLFFIVLRIHDSKYLKGLKLFTDAYTQK